MKWKLLMLLGLVWPSWAAAESALPSVDPATLGKDVGALGLMIMFLMQFLKKQRERMAAPFQWWQTLLIALALGEAVSALLFYSGYGARFGSAPPPWTWMLFGLVAAALGAGARDLLMSFAERGRTQVTIEQAQVAPASDATEAPPVEIMRVNDPSQMPGFVPEPDSSQTAYWPAPPFQDDAPLVHDGNGPWRQP